MYYLKGNYTLRSDSVPSMHSLIRKAARKVPNPDPAEVAAGRDTVYDTWLRRASPESIGNSQIEPRYASIYKLNLPLIADETVTFVKDLQHEERQRLRRIQSRPGHPFNRSLLRLRRSKNYSN